MKLYIFRTVPLSIISNGTCLTGLCTAFEQDQDVPARKLSTTLYDIHHCCMYSE